MVGRLARAGWCELCMEECRRGRQIVVVITRQAAAIRTLDP